MQSEPWNVEVFYDGECPLCTREIGMLRRWDKKKKIRFTDIMDPAFDANQFGLTHDDFMSQIRGRLPDGRMIVGMEVFRQLYSNVGYRWLVAPTRLPIIKQICDLGYWVFAKNRLRLTGRCKDGQCKVDLKKNSADS